MGGAALPSGQITSDEVRDRRRNAIEVPSALRLCASAVKFLFRIGVNALCASTGRPRAAPTAGGWSLRFPTPRLQRRRSQVILARRAYDQSEPDQRACRAPAPAVARLHAAVATEPRARQHTRAGRGGAPATAAGRSHRPGALSQPRAHLARLQRAACCTRPQDARNPLLERVKFLAIAASNLDEFFMKRIGGLKQQVGRRRAGAHGRRPHAAAADRRVLRRRARARATPARRWRSSCARRCAQHGVAAARATTSSTPTSSAALREHYFENIFPLVTPLAMDPAHPFPFISNLSLNLLVTRPPSRRTPSRCWRASRCRSAPASRASCASATASASCRSRTSWRTTSTCSSPAWTVESCELFRVTRNANTERDEEEADDLLAMIESELRDRRFAPIVRLEVGARHGPGPARHARRRARPRRARRRVRGRRHAGAARPDGDRASSTSRRCTIRRITRSTTRACSRRATSSTSSATPARCCSSIRTSRSRPRSSASCARRARIPKVRAIKMTLYRTSSDSNILELPRARRRATASRSPSSSS